MPNPTPDGTANTRALIDIRGLAFAFPGEKPLFDKLDFSLFPGQRAALLGGNGAGKTTLLRLIMGLARPAGGTITVFGAPCRAEKDFAAVRTRMGFVFQDADDQLFCPTVAEDVAFGPLNLGLTRGAARRRAGETLAALGLEGFENRVSYRLSGGEKKLVALATVLAMKPQLLLLDEPTAGLSEETAARIAGILLHSGLPCLIASHDRAFLARTATRTLRIRDGRVVEDGGENAAFHPDSG
jgi:cobalt/nickel transport system ATP-binding protein